VPSRFGGGGGGGRGASLFFVFVEGFLRGGQVVRISRGGWGGGWGGGGGERELYPLLSL